MIQLTSNPEKAVLRELLYISKAGLSKYDHAALVNGNTIVNSFTGEITTLYTESPIHIGVPMYSVSNVRKAVKTVVDERSLGEPISFNTTTTLRGGQVPVVKDFETYVSKGATGFIINAPTAWGKTRTAIELVKIIGRTTLIVVHTSELLNQWVERFTGHSDLTLDDIGTIADGKMHIKGKKVVVGLVHTLAMPHVQAALKKHFGFIIYDEVDRSLPPASFSSVSGGYQPKYRMGISATLKRADGKHVIFEKHLKQVFLIGLFSKEHAKVTQRVIVHHYTNSSGNIPLYAQRDVVKTKSAICTLISTNEERNRLIASYVVSGYNSGRKVFVISDRTLQLSSIRKILRSLGIPDEEMAYFCDQVTEPDAIGKKKKVSKAERIHALTTAKVGLASYKMMEAGTDVPDMALLIMASPVKMVTQTKGRNERPADKPVPVLVDIVDSHYKRAVSWFEHRESVYKDEKLPMKYVRGTTRPTDIVSPPSAA